MVAAAGTYINPPVWTNRGASVTFREDQKGGVMMKRTWCGMLAMGLLLGGGASELVAQVAPGGPGDLPTWTRADKNGMGTALSAASKVWFTLEGGMLTEVYYPRVDQANVRTLEFAVSDGRRVWFESRDTRHAVEQIEPDALVYQQTSIGAADRFTITKTYVTDPQTNTLLIDVTYEGRSSDTLYVLYHPAL